MSNKFEQAIVRILKDDYPIEIKTAAIMAEYKQSQRAMLNELSNKIGNIIDTTYNDTVIHKWLLLMKERPSTSQEKLMMS